LYALGTFYPAMLCKLWAFARSIGKQFRQSTMKEYKEEHLDTSLWGWKINLVLCLCMCVCDRRLRWWYVKTSGGGAAAPNSARNYVPCKTTRRARLHKFYFPRLTARGKYNGIGGGGRVGRFFTVMRRGNERRWCCVKLNFYSDRALYRILRLYKVGTTF
jgi:hypothetical protein